MKKIVILGLSALASLASVAMAAHIDTATTSASIVEPLNVEDGNSLDFGTVATNEGSCDVIISPSTTGDGTRTVPPPCAGYSSPLGPDDSDWTVSGQAGKAYVLILGDGYPSMTRTACAGGDNVIEISDYTIVGSPALTGDGLLNLSETGVLVAGDNDFAIGATFHLAGNQCPGQYNGHFSITALYY